MTDSATTRRPGGRNALVRARILAATVDLVARDGLSGLRYEDIAEQAGVNKTSVYRNWPDREELVHEALRSHVEQTLPLADTGDLRRDLADFMVAHSESLTSPAGYASLQAARQAGRDSELGRFLDLYLDLRRDHFRERVDRAVAKGEIPPVDIDLLFRLIGGPTHFQVNWNRGPLTRAQAEELVDVVLAGLRAV
ncbi:TetR/AcrR family transcriptional regulator [Amycolatopsis jejuensis]|uniref:TetR/AcrR family transcriptional regulator n=1 Tax=Amycolatopsis jejuensis TaxID=330084 RepID=UPI0005268B93|nr:TetR/AcrR family transcriptional regulator [Amycolatopsis jejuensis]